MLQALKDRILVLDGAMGTMLQQQGLRGNNEELNISHPGSVRAVHDAYIAAGADIITTNTFGANCLVQSGFGCGERAEEFARAGAAIARKAADAAGRRVFVAGSMGPTGKSLSLSLDLSDPTFREVSFDEMASAYASQVRGLVEGGVDCFLLETCFDSLNAKAAIYAIKHGSGAAGLPIMISASPLNIGGRLLTGQTIKNFWNAVRFADPVSFGLNCSMGVDGLSLLVEDVASWADCAVSCYPNAGMPDANGQYGQGPEMIAGALRALALKGCLNIAGGCCGTTPAHIAAISAALKDVRPRPIPAKSTDAEIPEGDIAVITVGNDIESAVYEAEEKGCAGISVLEVRIAEEVPDKPNCMQRFVRCIATDPYLEGVVLKFDPGDMDTAMAGLKNAPGRVWMDTCS